MTSSRRMILAVPLLVAAVLAGQAARDAVLAQTGATYPDKPIRLVVPFAPGGSSDFTGRLIAQKLGDILGQPVVVENKPGANGIIGADHVAKAVPDGYTLLVAPRELGVNPSIYKSLPYDTRKAFAWIGLATEGPFVVVVNPTVPAKTFDELVALARSKPGGLSYGSIGTGSISQFNVEGLKQKLGIDILHVPYKGAGPALAGALGGEVSMTIAAIPGALSYVKDNRLRAVAVGAPKRLPQMPDVPTLAELGVGDDVFVPTFFGLAAPAGTPRPIIDKLNAALNKAVAMPDLQEKLAANGMVSVAGTPEGMAATIEKDIDNFARLVKAIGLQPE